MEKLRSAGSDSKNFQPPIGILRRDQSRSDSSAQIGPSGPRAAHRVLPHMADRVGCCVYRKNLQAPVFVLSGRDYRFKMPPQRCPIRPFAAVRRQLANAHQSAICSRHREGLHEPIGIGRDTDIWKNGSTEAAIGRPRPVVGVAPPMPQIAIRADLEHLQLPIHIPADGQFRRNISPDHGMNKRK